MSWPTPGFAAIGHASSWADIWRNEGFTTYRTAVAGAQRSGALERDGEYPGRGGRKGQRLSRWTKRRRRLLAFDASNWGAVMVHELRREMGDEAFFGVACGPISPPMVAAQPAADFRRSLEEVAGFLVGGVFTRWLGPAENPGKVLQRHWLAVLCLALW